MQLLVQMTRQARLNRRATRGDGTAHPRWRALTSKSPRHVPGACRKQCGSTPKRGYRSERQFPIDDVGGIDSLGVGVVPALDLLVQQRFARMRSARPQEGHPVDRVDREREAVDLILDRPL